MKTILVGVLLLAGFVTLAVGQSTYVDFTTPATVGFSAYYPSGANTSNQSFSLANGGTVDVAFPTNDGSLYFSLADGAAVSNGGQWRFALDNPNLSNPYTASGFTVSFSGLYAADGSVITGVNFITGASSSTLISGTSGSFDVVAGTFTLTNSSSFVVPANSTLVLVGNFDLAAVPESSASALLAGCGALMMAMLLYGRRDKIVQPPTV